MRKAGKKLQYGQAQMAFTLLDKIIYDIDGICASPKEERATLLMSYRGNLYRLRAQYRLEMDMYKEELNI